MAVERYRGTLEISRASDDLPGQAEVLHALGDAAAVQADSRQAQRFYREALLLYRKVGGLESAGEVHWKLARHVAPGRRKTHLDAARQALRRMGRAELLGRLEEEFRAYDVTATLAI